MSCDICPVCKSELSKGCRSWHFLCNNCGYEKSSLLPGINLDSAHHLIDERARETGLRELRISNFKELLTKIISLKPDGGRLLEVGCAHGWFIELAKDYFEVLGLEPDENVFKAASYRGLPIRMGYFPDILDDDEQFDVIVFNDVFEHIANVEDILESCYKLLSSNGLLVLNLPSSGGLFYRISKIFCRFGNFYAFERLWQKGFPSPHLHYFSLSNLTSLLNQNGFDEKRKGSLSTLNLSGLYTRITYTGKANILKRISVYAGVVLLLPMLKILPGDIVYVISRRR